ncbi:MAG TPA: 3-hydroxyacyl-ACP dehydratase FabZ [Bacillota bacterium]|nr:3-hydroxyacyl-ACP dehydratase FabZ [Bacillota bacterium]HOA34719.1 3-hydroxyacyl-ACP dehydratase FabZ [Bacillota bacterium]HOL15750.1 3-hydroxyacyl-ACP dehydratase FabZ [Bacillota bacterium]HPZ11187.1 3-hydroxyacyl-ACP dehydratase FabZ [Bacillota bacterium]HQE09260.1 3-hydroxyacyl-ACP dehydratase FabZ [Bacillota bacterium]
MEVVMSPSELDINKILLVLPHRYPFLLVDRITGLVPGKSATGYKNVTINEPFFQGHFPGEPIMPGVLIVEALAQVGAVALLSAEESAGKLALFAGINRFRFKLPVRPGDRLELEAALTGRRGGIGKAEAEARVEGKIAAAGELMFALVDRHDPEGFN